MASNFTKKITPHVQAELKLAEHARTNSDIATEFSHLENAHVIGQESTYWHVNVHWQMLKWAVRNSGGKEFLGQVLRLVGAAALTAFGLIPQGNTGGANVSPFSVMPIKAEHQTIISKAKR
ncbi:DUF3703 domain-containing protein [Zhongshania guokunii]|uniref:DUF3703 domain-containing protein n=1 Tax=Zhongshania guokunii TaxID=641783 RepID=A0ABV3U2V8_9GAMM